MNDPTIWSGPSRALQFHMDLFHTADRMKTWVELNNERKFTANRVDRDFYQRMLLQTSIGGGEGSSVAQVRENLNDSWSDENLMRTVGSVLSEYELLNEAQTFYVSLHMQEMITAIAEQMEPEALYESDLPAKTGLIIFERPGLFKDVHPDTGELDERISMPCRAFGWNVADVALKDVPVPGIETIMWVDKTSYVRYYVKNMNDIGIDAGIEDAGEVDIEHWKTDHSGWALGVKWRESPDAEVLGNKLVTEEGTVHALLGAQRRWLLAFFRLYFQRITVGEVYHPNRYEKKRALRMGRPLEDGYIKVLRLRRAMEAERHGRASGDGNYFDHQFIVSGHWRRQWFRSLGPARLEDGSFNSESHRLIWVDSHIRGPIGAPLVVGQQVQAVVR